MMTENNFYELPKNWVWTEIRAITELIKGVTYEKQEASKEAKQGYAPILRANNISDEINYDDLVYVPCGRIKEEQYIKKYDILLAMSSGSKHLVGKAAQVLNDFYGGFGAFCGLIRVSGEINKKIIGYFFKSSNYREMISKLSSGVNINNLRREHIESIPIPIPPLTEQHRIVAKIEELFYDLEAGVEALKQAREKLKVYRAAVLKAAVEGALTAEWRQQHPHTEPASELLKRILVERRLRWEAEQLRIVEEKGKVSPQNWKTKYKEPDAPDTANLPPLPEGWCWASWGQVGYLRMDVPFLVRSMLIQGLDYFVLGISMPMGLSAGIIKILVSCQSNIQGIVPT